MNKDQERRYLDIKGRIGFHVGRSVSRPMVPPEHVYFSLTNRCNLRCQMCSVHKHPSTIEGELSGDKVKAVVLEIRQMGIRHVIFSGGDPFMRKDLFDIIEFSIKCGIEMVDIITNGVLLSDDQVRKLVEMGLNHITFSLDGIGTTNDDIRGQGVFAKVQTNIDRIDHYKRQLNCSTPSVGINFTVMEKNVQDMLPMIEFAGAKKCNIVLFQPIMFNNTKMSEKKTNDLWLKEESIKRLETVINKVIELKRTIDQPYICTDNEVLKIMPAYFRGKKAPGRFKCYEGFKRIVITCNGQLWSCSGVYGDLQKHSLREIWFSNAAIRMRHRVKRCTEHCLQDCVYYPSDIAGELQNLLSMFKQEEAVMAEIKDKLLDHLDLLGKDIEALQKRRPWDLASYINYKRSLGELFGLRQILMKY